MTEQHQAVGVSGQPVVCIPGERICAASSVGGGPVCGAGVHLHEGGVHASVSGEVRYSALDGGELVVSVEAAGGARGAGARVGGRVTAVVCAVHWSHATCRVLTVDDAALPAPVHARLRKEDVHSSERDATTLGHCVRHGDVILARVTSTDDAKQWRLSTAEPDLGVVVGRSRAGHVMSAVSWGEMRCPVTGEVERRKCARVPAPAHATTDMLAA